jgi:hypothetical protein
MAIINKAKNDKTGKDTLFIYDKDFKEISEKAVKVTVDLVFPKSFVKTNKNGKKYISCDFDTASKYLSISKDKEIK